MKVLPWIEPIVQTDEEAGCKITRNLVYKPILTQFRRRKCHIVLILAPLCQSQRPLFICPGAILCVATVRAQPSVYSKWVYNTYPTDCRFSVLLH